MYFLDAFGQVKTGPSTRTNKAPFPAAEVYSCAVGMLYGGAQTRNTFTEILIDFENVIEQKRHFATSYRFTKASSLLNKPESIRNTKTSSRRGSKICFCIDLIGSQCYCTLDAMCFVNSRQPLAFHFRKIQNIICEHSFAAFFENASRVRHATRPLNQHDVTRGPWSIYPAPSHLSRWRNTVFWLVSVWTSVYPPCADTFNQLTPRSFDRFDVLDIDRHKTVFPLAGWNRCALYCYFLVSCPGDNPRANFMRPRRQRSGLMLNGDVSALSFL